MNGTTTLASGRRRRKTITVLWIAVLAIVTVSLIYWEMTALLYIFATVGVTQRTRCSLGVPGLRYAVFNASNNLALAAM